MRKIFCLIACVGITLISFSQKKLGLMEYVTNTTIAIQAAGKEMVNGTGFFFVFNTDKGLAPSIITSKHLLADAKAITFFFMEADASNTPRYGKRQQITINRSDLTVIDHPDEDVDLAMIPVSSIITYFINKNIDISYHPLSENNIPGDSVIRTFRPLEDVIMVGHPAGLQKEMEGASLVKMGITATPVFVDHNKKKEFLITVPSYDGAAGAPVFIYQNSNFDRDDRRMDGQRLLLGGINTATYSKGFKEKIYPEDKRNIPQEDVSIVIKAERILDFKKMLHALKK